MNQRGWSFSSYLVYIIIFVVFILIIAFNVIRLSSFGVIGIADPQGETIMSGENNVDDYSTAESAVVDALKGYRADKYAKTDIEGTLIVTINDLVAGGYMKKIVLSGATCSGYGMISKNGKNYNYESYIKCGSYSTPGYTSSLDR